MSGQKLPSALTRENLTAILDTGLSWTHSYFIEPPPPPVYPSSDNDKETSQSPQVDPLVIPLKSPTGAPSITPNLTTEQISKTEREYQSIIPHEGLWAGQLFHHRPTGRPKDFPTSNGVILQFPISLTGATAPINNQEGWHFGTDGTITTDGQMP